MKKMRGLKRYWRNELKRIDKMVIAAPSDPDYREIFIKNSFYGRMIKTKQKIQIINKLKNITLKKQQTDIRDYLLMIDTNDWTNSAVLIFNDRAEVSDFFERKNYTHNIKKVSNISVSAFDEMDTFLLKPIKEVGEYCYFIDELTENQYLACKGSFVDDIDMMPYIIIFIARPEIITIGKKLLDYPID